LDIPIIPALERLRQENPEFRGQFRLNRKTLSLKKKKKKI
jgi:hypothetical protein